jgi:putative spermidine/putrescine transport system substrate-binding protein
MFAEATGLGPAIKDALPLLPSDARAASPALPANLQAGLPIDEGFWAENREKLETRFTAWLTK